MLADVAARFIERSGQQVEIRRNGACIAQAKCLPHADLGYLSFFPNTEIKEGDEVYFLLSEMLYTISQVEKEVIGDKIAAVKAFFSTKPQGQPLVVHGPYFAGGVSHSAIMANSPGATQNVTVGADQKEKAKEAIRLVLEVLDELNLPEEDRAEVAADAASAQQQIDSPKTKWQHVKDYFNGIKDKVTSALSGKIADAVVAKGETAVKAINDYLSTAG